MGRTPGEHGAGVGRRGVCLPPHHPSNLGERNGNRFGEERAGFRTSKRRRAWNLERGRFCRGKGKGSPESQGRDSSRE